MTRVLITGVAGFIGSHLLSHFLQRGYEVRGIDNFLTGKQQNLDAVLSENRDYASRFEMHREDIRNAVAMLELTRDVDLVIHEAAIGSVPWSIRDPMLAHETNLTGFLNILQGAHSNGVRRVVYASSSAVFGDATDTPATEGCEGEVLSPYAAAKRSQEIYAQAWARCYGLEIVGLRYFNVFGARQDPNGAYAAVIPKWINAMKDGNPCTIYGDGHSTRDYCHVANIVFANDLAAHVDLSFLDEGKRALAVNIGCGAETSLLELHEMMRAEFEKKYKCTVSAPSFEPVRLGDIERSSANIHVAMKILGFKPETSVRDGLEKMFADMN